MTSWKIGATFFAIAWAMNASPAKAYDAETHGLIMYQAYKESILSITGSSAIVTRLGLDRLDTPTPFNIYWQSFSGDLGPAGYYDNTSSFDVTANHTRQPNEYERCQMQHLADVGRLDEGDAMLNGSKVAFLPTKNWLMRGDLREDDLTPFLYSTFAKDRCG